MKWNLVAALTMTGPPERAPPLRRPARVSRGAHAGQSGEKASGGLRVRAVGGPAGKFSFARIERARGRFVNNDELRQGQHRMPQTAAQPVDNSPSTTGWPK